MDTSGDLAAHRLSALPSFATSRDAGRATGEAFARELDDAVERTRGVGQAAERLEEQQSDRRAARRAGFGRVRADAGEARVVEDEAPAARAQPIAAAPAPEIDVVEPPMEPVAACPADSSSAAPPPSAPPAPEPAAARNAHHAAALSPMIAAVARPPASEGLALAPAVPSSETSPSAALPTAAAARAPRAALAAAPSTDAGLLQRAEEILRQVQLHLAPGVKRLTLDLQPDELGRMAIQLALRNGKVTAIVRAERPETLAALDAHQPELRELLARRGIAVDSLRFERGFAGSRASAAARPAHDPTPSVPSHRAPSRVDFLA